MATPFNRDFCWHVQNRESNHPKPPLAHELTVSQDSAEPTHSTYVWFWSRRWHWPGSQVGPMAVTLWELPACHWDHKRHPSTCYFVTLSWPWNFWQISNHQWHRHHICFCQNKIDWIIETQSQSRVWTLCFSADETTKKWVHHIIQTTADSKLRKKGLTDSSLGLGDILAEGRNSELCHAQSRDIERELHLGDHTKVVHQVRKQQCTQSCNGCSSPLLIQGGRTNCPAWGKQCASCGKMNHFARCCRSSASGGAQGMDTSGKPTSGKLHKPQNIQFQSKSHAFNFQTGATKFGKGKCENFSQAHKLLQEDPDDTDEEEPGYLFTVDIDNDDQCPSDNYCHDLSDNFECSFVDSAICYDLSDIFDENKEMTVSDECVLPNIAIDRDTLDPNVTCMPNDFLCDDLCDSNNKQFDNESEQDNGGFRDSSWVGFDLDMHDRSPSAVNMISEEGVRVTSQSTANHPSLISVWEIALTLFSPLILALPVRLSTRNLSQVVFRVTLS